MTTNQQSEINELVSNLRFNEIALVFKRKSFSFEELRRLYKKQSLFDKPEFWNSKLPLLYLPELLNSNLKTAFYHKYLTIDKNANNDLNLYLFSNFEDEFIHYFKMKRSFLLPNFLNSLENISTEAPKVLKLLKESKVLLEEWKSIETAEINDDNFLNQLRVDEIFMGIVLYYENMKSQTNITANQARQFEKENALIDFLQHTISLVKKRKNIQFEFSSNDEMQKEFNRYYTSTSHRRENELILPLNPIYKFIYSISKRFIHISGRKNLIELYQSGYADIVSTPPKPAQLSLNNKYERFRVNDAKKGVEELYFLGMSSLQLLADPMKRVSIDSDLKMFDFYGIPHTLDLPSTPIDLEKVLKLLLYFSVFKGPKERTVADHLFIELFGQNEAISLFDEQKLKTGIKSYFTWPEPEVNEIMNFLTFDLKNDVTPKLWIHRPFLKIDKKVIWLGTFLKDRRWSNVLLNKVKSELATSRDNKGLELSKAEKSANKAFIRSISTNLEKKIEAVFKLAGFRTTQGLKYKSNGVELGDLDVVAFKDNHLFICEAKSGERSHDPSQAAYTETVKLENKAVRQLKRALENKELYKTELEKRLGCKIDYNTAKVSLLIVTDTFEGDHFFNRSDIYKVSLLELDVILKNKKKELALACTLFDSGTKSNKFTIPRNVNLNLWNNQKYLSPKRFLEIIENQEVWSDLTSKNIIKKDH